MYQIKAQQEIIKDHLIRTAGTDPLKDKQFIGNLEAFEQVINIEFEDEVSDG